MTTRIDTTKYTDQTLVIPADICKIIERENLINYSCDDFGLNFEIENGKVKVTDMLEYIQKDYKLLEPKEAWDLVRKWWVNIQEANKGEIAIKERKDQIAKLQTEINQLEKVEKKWRIW